MARLSRHPNLLVMRTVSKLGLAGLRLGALAGAPAWLSELAKVRLPYNINVLTQLAAAEVLRHDKVLTEQAQAIKLERGRLLEALAQLPGVKPYPSEANFILFGTRNAERVFRALKERGVLVKCLHGSHRLLENCLRVTVGTPAENSEFLSALERSLAA